MCVLQCVPGARAVAVEGRAQVDCYASSVNWASLDVMEAQALHVVSLGFQAIKIKLGQPVARAIEAATRLREAVPPHVRLSVDANWAYSLDEEGGVGQ